MKPFPLQRDVRNEHLDTALKVTCNALLFSYPAWQLRTGRAPIVVQRSRMNRG